MESIDTAVGTRSMLASKPATGPYRKKVSSVNKLNMQAQSNVSNRDDDRHRGGTWTDSDLRRYPLPSLGLNTVRRRRTAMCNTTFCVMMFKDMEFNNQRGGVMCANVLLCE
jgi:hypothetical protein